MLKNITRGFKKSVVRVESSLLLTSGFYVNIVKFPVHIQLSEVLGILKL